MGLRARQRRARCICPGGGSVFTVGHRVLEIFFKLVFFSSWGFGERFFWLVSWCHPRCKPAGRGACKSFQWLTVKRVGRSILCDPHLDPYSCRNVFCQQIHSCPNQGVGGAQGGEGGDADHEAMATMVRVKNRSWIIMTVARMKQWVTMTMTKAGRQEVTTSRGSELPTWLSWLSTWLSPTRTVVGGGRASTAPAWRFECYTYSTIVLLCYSAIGLS